MRFPTVATALLVLRGYGHVLDWGVGAVREKDNGESLRRHAREFFAGYEFLGFYWEDEPRPEGLPPVTWDAYAKMQLPGPVRG